MKRKIISVLLLCALLFSMFTVCTSAEDGNVDVVKNEIQTNYPNLDLTSIPGNKAAVIGAIEDITDETSLYLYIYSPIDRVLSGYVKELVVSCESVEGEKTSFKIDTIAFSVIAKSNDGAFYKARIDLSSNLSKMQGYDAIHTFSWSNTIIKTNKYSFQNLNDFTFNFDYLSGGSSDKSNVKITYDIKALHEFDANYTYYRTGATTSKKVVDEIHTVYFSIPEEYEKYYSSLYSLASSYIKKQTSLGVIAKLEQFGDSSIFDPCFGEDAGFISSDYKTSIGSSKTYISADVGYNLPDYWDTVYFVDRIIDFPEIWLMSEKDDYEVPVEDLFAYIEHCEKKSLNKDLFVSSETVNWSEKTINDTFDSISYLEKASFYEKINAYGLWVALKLEKYKDNPEKLQEILEENGCPADVMNYLDRPYLMLCDAEFKIKAALMSDEDLSKKCLIREEDIPAFRKYLLTNDNVVIYHFDVVDYYSEEITVFGDYKDYCLFQQYLYYGFSVIDITFNVNGEFISVAVNSTPMNVGGNPSFEDNGIKPGHLKRGGDWREILEKILRIVFSVLLIGTSCVALVYGCRYLKQVFVSNNGSKTQRWKIKMKSGPGKYKFTRPKLRKFKYRSSNKKNE